MCCELRAVEPGHVVVVVVQVPSEWTEDGSEHVEIVGLVKGEWLKSEGRVRRVDVIALETGLLWHINADTIVEDLGPSVAFVRN